MLRRQQPWGEDDGYANRASHLWCGLKAVNVIRWMLRRRAEQSSGLSADSTNIIRLINDEAANGVSHRLCSRSDGRMRRPSSCTDDHGTKAVAKGVKRMHQRSSRSDERMRRQNSRTDGRKTKTVRRLRKWSTHTNGHETKGSGMDALMKLTNSEVTRRPLLLESVERRDKKDRMLARLKLMLCSRSATSMTCTE